MATKRLIIISLPPPELFLEIKKVQEKISFKTGAREAVLYPPHITLRTGALIPEGEIGRYIRGLEAHLANREPFQVKVKALEFFEYLHKDAPAFFTGFTLEKEGCLAAFHDYLWDYDLYAKSVRKNYEPHLSLAYKDLLKEDFLNLRDNLKSELPEILNPPFFWVLDNLWLYHFTGEKWEAYWGMTLGSSTGRAGAGCFYT
ncbi:MAG: 2'-5' RNA ligase family protein [Spirochaetales bacterium]|nr:2'-5' RNA ligase family protein [Spirochaetales bacterium]